MLNKAYLFLSKIKSKYIAINNQHDKRKRTVVIRAEKILIATTKKLERAEIALKVKSIPS